MNRRQIRRIHYTANQKRAVFAGAMVAAGFAGYFFTGSSRPPLGRGEIVCPLGHDTIRTAQVWYGYLAPSAYDSPELKSREAVSGGCIIFKNSPAFNGICTQCGFRYNPADKSWIQSTQMSAECLPMPPIFADLLLFFPEASDQRFYQCILRGATLEQSGWFEFIPALSREETFAKLDSYFAEMQIKMPPVQENEAGLYERKKDGYRKYRWIADGMKNEVSVSTKYPGFSVSIKIETADKEAFLTEVGEAMERERPDYAITPAARLFSMD